MGMSVRKVRSEKLSLMNTSGKLVTADEKKAKVSKTF